MPSTTATAPDLEHLALLDGVDFRPVFIMGNARSGTTFLYQLLDKSDRFNCVTAYHVIKYDELLARHLDGTTEQAKQELRELFERLGVPAARFDGVGVSPDSPEEYGFALTDGHLLRLGRKTLPRFVELCRKVQFVSEPGRPLLLKNPWDYGQFLYVKRQFPESRFIFLHRNPADVIRSMSSGMTTLLAEKNAYHALVARFYDRMMDRPLRRGLTRALYSPGLGLGSRLIRWHVRRTARYFLENVGRLPESDHVGVRYEDLCREPAAEVARILSFLELPANTAVPYEQFVRPGRTKGRSTLEQRHALDRLNLQPYLERCGYDEMRLP